MCNTERQTFMRELVEEGRPFFATYEVAPFVSLALTWGRHDQQSAGFFFDAQGSAMCGTVMGLPTPGVVQGLIEKGKAQGYG